MRPIDADALKDELELADFETDSRMFGGQTVLFEDSVFKIVDSAPTLSPDDVRGVGEWIWHDKYGWDDSLECSCCAEEFVVYDGEFPGIDSFKFCPNCGAKMKGVSEDTRKN